MLIKTMRFGEIDIAEEQIITFPLGLPGFPEQKRFIPVEYRSSSPLFFLQAVDLPDLAFIIGDPFKIVGGYVVDIPQEEMEALEINAPEEASVYVILTLRQGGKVITANLVAPLIINTTTKRGRQSILFNSPYTSRFPLYTQPEAQAK